LHLLDRSEGCVAGVGDHLPGWLTSRAAYKAVRTGWYALPRRLTPAQRQGRRYDELTISVMRAILERDSVCVDVGASSGALLQQMCALAPAGKHHAFEPLPTMAAELQARFPAVQVHAVALADTNGESEFVHVVSNPAYSGLRVRRYDRPDERLETITVPTRRLDDVLPADAPVSFMKIDVEGGEYGVLAGGLGTLRRCKPVVAFEHGGGWTTENYGTNSGMLFELLHQAGLDVSLLEDWLGGRPSMSVAEFINAQMVNGEYFFLAHPPLRHRRSTTR
jgi:FkbM family methyltransferase